MFSCVLYAHCRFLCSLAPAAYNLSVRVLIRETFTQADIFAVVNCPVVALSVFYSTVLTRRSSLRFLQL